MGGYPAILHELGDAVFWQDQDGRIEFGDAVAGYFVAMDNVGRKYLQRPMYDELRSDAYRRILEYIGSLPPGPIRRSDAQEKLSPKEAKKFDNLMSKMRDLGVIKLGPLRGEYVFTNELYEWYVRFRRETPGQEKTKDAPGSKDSQGNLHGNS